MSKDQAPEPKKKTPIGVHLLAGGGAGLSEALVCRESCDIGYPLELSCS